MVAYYIMNTFNVETLTPLFSKFPDECIFFVVWHYKTAADHSLSRLTAGQPLSSR